MLWLKVCFNLCLLFVGLAGLAAVVGMGAYKYSRRGQMSTSVFLMQLRVAAQGTVVAALSVGLAYTMTQKYILHNPDYQLPSHDHSTTHDATAHASHDASGSIVTPSSSEHPTKH